MVLLLHQDMVRVAESLLADEFGKRQSTRIVRKRDVLCERDVRVSGKQGQGFQKEDARALATGIRLSF
jgi:hypothetical protein